MFKNFVFVNGYNIAAFGYNKENYMEDNKENLYKHIAAKKDEIEYL